MKDGSSLVCGGGIVENFMVKFLKLLNFKTFQTKVRELAVVEVCIISTPLKPNCSRNNPSDDSLKGLPELFSLLSKKKYFYKKKQPSGCKRPFDRLYLYLNAGCG